MGPSQQDYEEARQLRNIAFKGLGAAIVLLGVVMGFSAWLAWGH
jgi:hypothetical protein